MQSSSHNLHRFGFHGTTPTGNRSRGRDSQLQCPFTVINAFLELAKLEVASGSITEAA